MHNLILPIVEKVERKTIALLLVPLEVEESIYAVARTGRRQVTFFPQRGKGRIRKGGEPTKRKGQPIKPPLLHVEGSQREYRDTFSEIRLTAMQSRYHCGRKFRVQDE